MTFWADNIKFIKDVLDSKYKKIEDALGKVEHILTDSNGHPYIRQHILGKHDKDHMERILKFLGKELSEGEDTDDPRYGTFENATSSSGVVDCIETNFSAG